MFFSNSDHPVKDHAATHTVFLIVEQIIFYRKSMDGSIQG